MSYASLCWPTLGLGYVHAVLCHAMPRCAMLCQAMHVTNHPPAMPADVSMQHVCTLQGV